MSLLQFNYNEKKNPQHQSASRKSRIYSILLLHETRAEIELMIYLRIFGVIGQKCMAHLFRFQLFNLTHHFTILLNAL